MKKAFSKVKKTNEDKVLKRRLYLSPSGYKNTLEFFFTLSSFLPGCVFFSLISARKSNFRLCPRYTCIFTPAHDIPLKRLLYHFVTSTSFSANICKCVPVCVEKNSPLFFLFLVLGVKKKKKQERKDLCNFLKSFFAKKMSL